MFEQFTDSAIRVVVLAVDEAQRLGHTSIGAVHMFIAHVRAEEDAARTRIFADLGISLEAVRKTAAEITERGVGSLLDRPTFSAEAVSVLAPEPAGVCCQFGDGRVNARELLLRLLEEPVDDSVIRLLDILGTNADHLRALVREEYVSGAS